MAREKRNPIEMFAVVPWPLGVIFGIGGFLAVRFGLPAMMHGNQFTPAILPIANLMLWLLLAGGLLGAAMSWVGEHRRRRMLDAQQGLDNIAALGWRQFEQLVGEAFRRQGYAVEEHGLGGADGGIDLILRKDGRCVLVQCKQWRRRQVPVNVVREMFGLLAHHRADSVKIACVGTFTRDAARFAEGKPIELIGGEELMRMIRDVQAAQPENVRPAEIDAPAPTAPASSATLACPRCGKAMIERSNRNTGQKFLGCSAFPACRGVR